MKAIVMIDRIIVSDSISETGPFGWKTSGFSHADKNTAVKRVSKMTDHFFFIKVPLPSVIKCANFFVAEV